jgi:transposase
LESQITDIDREIGMIAKTDDACQRLQTVPGVGPLAATAMVAALGNGSAFERGRQFSAWLAWCHSSARLVDKRCFCGSSKRGNEYLRRLFIHGARSVGLQVKREGHAWRQWMTALQQRTRANVATAAPANKLARIAWSVLSRNEPYRLIAPAIGS